ncbi:MAG TPA: DUF3313 domain-containing protein [Nitrospira sp.]|nr:DUF3313 domain-containing protein [Nitrospira sp.]
MFAKCAMVWVVLSVMLTGCTATKQARGVTPSGFLQDLYPEMREGKGNEALLVYRNPRVDWAAKATYHKVLLDPVMIWRGKDSTLEGPERKEVQAIADAFYALLYQELAKDYEMVTEPGPKTLRMQAALTDVGQSRPALDILSSVPAPFNVAFVASTVKTLSTGKPLFKGEASIEGKLMDADSGEVLAAAVDRRVGGRFLDREVFDSWNDVHGALRYWAQLTRFRLCQMRKQADCVQPES